MIDYRGGSLEDQRFLLAKTFPDGRIWTSKHDTTRVLGRLVLALATEIHRTFRRIGDAVNRELDPLQARQTILEWEESVGIPDICFDRSPSLIERRRRVGQKLTNFGDLITNADIVSLLADFGEAVEIIPGNEDNAERLGFGAPPYNATQLRQIRHTVAVRVESDAPTFALPFPIEFASGQGSLLQCLILRTLPANVAVQFFFGENLLVPFVIDTPIGSGAFDLGALALAGAGVIEDAVSGNAAALDLGGLGLSGAGAVAAAVQAALLDAWTNESTVSSTPGSKVVSAGSNRQLLVQTTLRTTDASSVTSLSYGGQAMALVARQTSAVGPDLDTAIWRLGETGLAAATDANFSLSTAGGLANVQFRLNAGSYEGIDQASPVVDSFIALDESGGNPASQAMTTDNLGLALAFLATNRGTSDVGATEDAAFSNMTERLEVAGSRSYSAIAETGTDGTSFTPGATIVHETSAHLIALSLRAA